MRKYVVYMDDTTSVFKVFVPAESEKKARQYCEGNGEIIAVRDVTEEYPIDIHKVTIALKNANFGKAEIELITRCLTECRIAE